MAIYNGFSTVNSLSQRKFVLTNNELIKQDLLNALMTPLGSRVMQPNYGCIAWNKLFESLTATDVQDIASNITGIINNDPRLTLNSIDISQNVNTITVTLVVTYTQTNQVEQLVVNFANQSSAANSF